MNDFWSDSSGPLRWCIQRFDDWARARQIEDEATLGTSAQFWGNPRWSLFCCAVLLITLAMPATGFGFRLCLFHQMTGLDCPGCGMTRGISHFWRGQFLDSLQLHLFTPIAFAFLWIQSSSLFVGKRLKGKMLHLIDRHDTFFRYLWVAGVASFFIYGGLRIAYDLIDRGFLRGI